MLNNVNKAPDQPKLKEDQGMFLMDMFVASDYQKGDIFALNKCQMYLKVLCISDIINAAGNGIWAICLECQP
jgi:hypothetical protein